MTGLDDGTRDPQVVARLYAEHGEELRRFLQGVLRDRQLAHDVLQATFAKLVEHLDQTQPASRKAWLFRVAFHEAMALRREQDAGKRALEQAAWQKPIDCRPGDDPLVRREIVETVRAALNELPAQQQQVVIKRIYEDKKFAEIASELQVPLGTVLWRMQAALKKLRCHLQHEIAPPPAESLDSGNHIADQS